MSDKRRVLFSISDQKMNFLKTFQTDENTGDKHVFDISVDSFKHTVDCGEKISFP